jgi:deoxyribodipyrimidine photo-lyase
MEQLWPAGTDAAREILRRFVSQKCRIGQLDVSPLNKGGINVLGKGAMAGKGKGDTRIGRYSQDRDMADRDSSSRISPYLASGAISIRELIRETISFLGVKKVDVSKENGPGFWVTELGRFLGFSVSNN